jgi:hypothetical protein
MLVPERIWRITFYINLFFYAAVFDSCATFHAAVREKKITPQRQQFAEAATLLRRRIRTFRHRVSYLYGVCAYGRLICQKRLTSKTATSRQ